MAEKTMLAKVEDQMEVLREKEKAEMACRFREQLQAVRRDLLEAVATLQRAEYGLIAAGNSSEGRCDEELGEVNAFIMQIGGLERKLLHRQRIGR